MGKEQPYSKRRVQEISEIKNPTENLKKTNGNYLRPEMFNARRYMMRNPRTGKRSPKTV